MGNPIEFQLFAPYNKGAALISSFSNWEEISLDQDSAGYFRTAVELEDGVYQYKFRVQSKSWFLEPDQWVEIIDPYATDIDPETQTAIARIHNGKRVVDDYCWCYDDQPLPENQALVLYEMHVLDFVGEQNPIQGKEQYKQVIEKLDYLQELGINAIQLMPIHEYPWDYSWGYKVRHFFATESNYGSTKHLKQLIDQCHARGIRVILDGIYNHSDEKTPLSQIDHDYWYHHGPKNPDDPANYWGPEFNFAYYDENLKICPAWKFIGDVVRFWIQEYHIDGIRFDAVRQIANLDFLHWITQQTQQAAAAKPFYNIAEYIPEKPQITQPEGPMAGCWHESFRIFVLQAICDDQFNPDKLQEALDAKRQGYAGTTSVINYLASHDREHLLRELGNRGIFDQAAFQRAKLGAVLLITALGVPMLAMGEEFGES